MSLIQRPRDVIKHDLRNLKLDLTADGNRHGISSLIWKEGNVQLAKYPFVLNLYRMLESNGLLGEARDQPYSVSTDFRDSMNMPTQSAIRLSWEPWKGHPIRLSATYGVSEPNRIDLTIEIEALAPTGAYEVFLSSYFQLGLEPHVIIRQQQNARDTGTPVLHAVRHFPFVHGHYVTFPRDTAAALLKYDGRWQHGKAPVIWATSPTYAVPMAFMAPSRAREPASGDTNHGPVVIQMASRNTCFSVNTTYASSDPDDIVARHNAVYFSLFGLDLQEGDKRTANLRMIVVPELPTLDALLELHRQFESEQASPMVGSR